MKKLFVLLLALMLIMSFAVGCAGDATTEGNNEGQDSTENSNVATDVPAFTLEINGTEFTQEDAAELEYVTKDVQKTSKDGSMDDAQWSGYQVDAILQAAGVTEYTTVVVEAADGYSSEISAEQAQKDTTLIGLARTGEELGADEVPTIVVDGEGSNVWVKGIVKVTTN